MGKVSAMMQRLLWRLARELRELQSSRPSPFADHLGTYVTRTAAYYYTRHSRLLATYNSLA